jgi:ABC-type antimicrobial peptide transport system permease subunit
VYISLRQPYDRNFRIALGAQRAHVAGSILTQTMWLLIIGVAVGVPLSMLFASVAASLF